MAQPPLRSIPTAGDPNFHDRLPPQNLDAERSLLGGLMLSKDALLQIEAVRPEDFYRDRHALIYEAMLELHANGEPIDHVTLTEILKSKGTLEQVGGHSYIAELMEAVPTTSNLEYYAKIVVEKSTLRKLIKASTQLANRAYENSEAVRDLVADAEKKILEIARGSVQERLAPISSVIYDAIHRLEEIYKNDGNATGIETGFSDFDRMTSGLQPGQLIVIAARPGMGKTSFTLNIAAHAAVKQQKAVAFFSLEMSKEELVSRLLCSEARIDMSELRSGLLHPRAWENLTRAATALNAAPIFFDDNGMMDIKYIMGKCRRQKAEGKLDMVIIDYLQLMSGGAKSERREQEISEISRGLKALSKELKVPVIALSQLNRMVEQRPDKRPHMADLRESGAIEQDADIIGFIYRHEMYAKDDSEREQHRGKAEFIIAKHRAGPTDTVTLTFLSKYTKFENFASEERFGGV